jgi:hypothetical protein
VEFDALDFHSLYASNNKEGGLLLFCEIELPGKPGWSLKIDNKLTQTATFRP